MDAVLVACAGVPLPAVLVAGRVVVREIEREIVSPHVFPELVASGAHQHLDTVRAVVLGEVALDPVAIT